MLGNHLQKVTQRYIFLPKSENSAKMSRKISSLPASSSIFQLPSTVGIAFPHDLRLEAVAASPGGDAALLADGPGEAGRDEGVEDRGAAGVVAVQVLILDTERTKSHGICGGMYGYVIYRERERVLQYVIYIVLQGIF